MKLVVIDTIDILMSFLNMTASRLENLAKTLCLIVSILISRNIENIIIIENGKNILLKKANEKTADLAFLFVK